MKAGKLDQKITIQALTTSQDTMGATTESWAAITGAPTWAAYVPVRGLERIEAGKVEGVGVIKLRIRRDASVVPSNRVVHGSKTYEVKSVEDYHRQGDMVLHCEEVT